MLQRLFRPPPLGPTPLVLLALLLAAGCAATHRPAIDSELYPLYRGTELTVMREGLLAHHPSNARGTDYECFPQESGKAVVGGLSFGASLAPGIEFVRPIKAGEKILIHEIVYYEGLAGPWARATLLADDQPCIIGARNGLKAHLLLTAQELAQWKTLPADLREHMLAHEIKVGMSRAQVLVSWGPPFKRIHSQSPTGTAETWLYQRGERRLVYLNFQGDSLTGWRE